MIKVLPPMLAAYNACKHGVVGLTKCTGVEYASQGIRVNAICPGRIETPMTAMVVAVAIIGFAAHAEEPKPVMKVIAVKNEASVTVPAENFTGSARVTMVVKGEDPSNLSCGYVEFQPGARSNWHTHPKGQLLIVTDGEGRIQEWRKPVQVIKPGDVVWTPPGVKHWHGASPTSSMTHAAVTETLDGKSVQWMEHVTDEQYKAQAK